MRRTYALSAALALVVGLALSLRASSPREAAPAQAPRQHVDDAAGLLFPFASTVDGQCAGTRKDLGIDVRVQLPGVGQNLHDHALSPVVFSASRPVPPPVPGLQLLH